MGVIKHVKSKSCFPKLIFLNENQCWKDSGNSCDIILYLKVQF